MKRMLLPTMLMVGSLARGQTVSQGDRAVATQVRSRTVNAATPRPASTDWRLSADVDKMTDSKVWNLSLRAVENSGGRSKEKPLLITTCRGGLQEETFSVIMPAGDLAASASSVFIRFAKDEAQTVPAGTGQAGEVLTLLSFEFLGREWGRVALSHGADEDRDDAPNTSPSLPLWHGRSCVQRHGIRRRAQEASNRLQARSRKVKPRTSSPSAILPRHGEERGSL